MSVIEAIVLLGFFETVILFLRARMFLLLTSIPAAIFGSLVAFSLEDARKDFRKIGYAWLLNFVVTPVMAFAALKGLLIRKGYFHRTCKTGRIVRKRF